MGFDGYMMYGEDGEVFNVARLARLARAMGVTGVSIPSESVAAIDTVFGYTDADMADINNAPWANVNAPESLEFCGLLPLGVEGLSDSAGEAAVTEYVTDGGNVGLLRKPTRALVFSARIIASTERGAEFGKRWIERLLRGTTDACAGANMAYFRSLPRPGSGEVMEFVHFRDVRLTRALRVTGQTRRRCSATWTVTFTMVANDPCEYGDEKPRIFRLGGDRLSQNIVADYGPAIEAAYTDTDTYYICPVYNYSPIYDPLYPALVAPPAPPTFYPTGWNVEEGQPYKRYSHRFTGLQPAEMDYVPVIKITSSTEARMLRVGIWSFQQGNQEQCDPVFGFVLTYLPPNQTIYIDGEQSACYSWPGYGQVRRVDSLVYSFKGEPIDWTVVTGSDPYFITLDTLQNNADGTYEGAGNVRVSLSLVPRSG